MLCCLVCMCRRGHSVAVCSCLPRRPADDQCRPASGEAAHMGCHDRWRVKYIVLRDTTRSARHSIYNTAHEHYIALSYIALRCFTLHSIAIHSTSSTLLYPALFNTNYTAMFFTAPHCALHYITQPDRVSYCISSLHNSHNT